MMCSPFGVRLPSFGALSRDVSGSFLRRFLFLLVRVAFALLQAFPWYLLQLQTSVSAVSLSLRCFLLLLGSSLQFVVLSSFIGHTSFMPLPPLSLGASRSFSFGL